MRTEVASGLVIDSTGTVSQPLPTNGLNGIRADLAVVSASTSMDVTAKVEESNDLQNWSTALITATLSTGFPAFTVSTTSSVTTMARMTYVRVKLATSTGTACVTAGIDLYKYVT